jgi:hypothetical protein
MSVARNEFGYAPYYDWKVSTPGNSGLDMEYVKCAAASPTHIVAFGKITVSSTTTYKAFQSTDAIDWTEITSAPNTAITGVAYGNDVFVAVGGSGVIYTAPGTNPSTWTARTKAGASSYWFYNVKFVNGTFFAMQEYDNVQKSTDGITWTTEMTGGSFSYTAGTNADQYDTGSRTYSVIYDDGVYIHFTGDSSGTAGFRIALNPSTATSTGSYTAGSTSVTHRYGRQDIGDGLGPLIQVWTGTLTTSNVAMNIVRGVPRHVNSRIGGSGYTSYWALGSENHMVIPWPSPKIMGTVDSTTLNHYLPIYFTDGWYNIVYPGGIPQWGGTSYPEWSTGYNIPSSAKALMSGRWRQEDVGHFPDLPSPNVMSSKIIYPFVSENAASLTIGNLLDASSSFTFKGSEYILFGFGQVNQAAGQIKMIKSIRAFRRPRTTVNYRLGGE